MNIQELYKMKSQFAIKNVGNEKVLVPIKNDIANMTEIFTLNEVGSFIWDKIDGKNTEEDIVVAITNEFDVAELIAKNDMSNFFKKLNTLMSNI